MSDIPSPEEVTAKRTPNGGWTRAQLAEWGVPWPPPKGWRNNLEAQWKASKTRPWNVTDHLTTPEQRAAYLAAAYEDGNPELISAVKFDLTMSIDDTLERFPKTLARLAESD